ncbi:MAG: HAD hydrolase-like protein [Phascolarctobacterium sp.]|nr:HAD hydrolase-like protein [Phascolarctobacterium sp.]
MKHLMWDIDGTLLLTNLAGYDALCKAVKDYYFLDAYEIRQSLAGRTDSDIIKKIILNIRGRFLPAEAASILIRYDIQLAKELPTHKGKIMKNVEKTLAYFMREDSKYENCLCTGNIKNGAKQKLAYYNLDKYFNFNHSVFGELAEERSELAKYALSRIYLEDRSTLPSDFIFIGDTPNDVRCAKAIGARCIIVLDGSASKREDFAEVNPWKLLDCLPDDPAEFERLLDEE